MEDKKFIRPCTLIYFLLLGLTVTTWFIGTQGLSGLQISLLVLGFALIKGQLIGDYFMGLKQVSGFWRWPVTLWLILVGSLVTYAFMISI
ncbi:cytochrome C oxidase subunit IV family protein [Thiolapillus sp.]